jgi:hypothetical protein
MGHIHTRFPALGIAMEWAYKAESGLFSVVRCSL